MFPDFAIRSTQAELIDGTAYTPEEYDGNLADLRRVNKYLGGRRALAKHLFPMIEKIAQKERTVRLLDIGTGSADIPKFIIDWARGKGIKVEFTVLDYNWLAAHGATIESAGYSEITVVQADAMNLPFADKSFHFVLASLFLHHFETRQAISLLRNFARVASVAFIINDLRRHPIAYYTIKVLTQVFTTNRLVRHDSAVSVLRGFTEKDIAEIAQGSKQHLKVFRHFPYRYIMIGDTSKQL